MRDTPFRNYTIMCKHNFSCKNCEDRSEGCHSYCEKYKQEKSAYNKKTADIKDGYKIVDRYIINSIVTRNDKIRRRNKRFG